MWGERKFLVTRGTGVISFITVLYLKMPEEEGKCVT